jgi:hypothetical protein
MLNYTPEQILALLRANPLTMAELTAGLNPHQLKQITSVDAWSLLDLLAHVRATANGWGADIGGVLGQAGLIARRPAIEPYLAKRTPATGEYAPAFRDYQQERVRLLKVLTPLSAADWLRSAPNGRTQAKRPQTVLRFAQHLVRHEQTHLQQMRRIVRALHQYVNA